MKVVVQSVVVSGLLLAATGPLVYARETQITPLPLPPIGALPPAPDGAQATFDENALEVLTSMTEMSRLIGGGIAQLFASALTAENLMTRINDAAQAQRAAVSGPKPFPVNNSGAEVAAREGGPGLSEMANAALGGETVGPQGVQAALTGFRNRYHLDDAFAHGNDKLHANAIIAHVSAQGAVTASTAEDSYKRANASMGRINGYITALESSNDLKTSVDINTRVMIEIAQQLNETLRTQAAIASLAGSYFMALGAESAEPESIRGLEDFNR
ncbi:MAG: hypothetical protein E5Y88_29075 [Mesorhizobium sp.]|uniref:type IV secretion system protein n=1 Tax=Mesorhizobium sp. TaxID=1871066 RepID=UPI001208C9FD|nr:type IV secretion system protein [Mesorhizobium sp.]TIL22206.1 MAG: hypothetical protein E5Y88_29075 [Mesorhizobium sp.]